MIFNIDFETVKNIENKIQISIAKNTKAGEKIVAESLSEYPKDRQGNDIAIAHPENAHLWKNPDNYFLMKGAIKMWFKWKEGDPFQTEHIDDYVTLQNSLDSDYLVKVNHTVGENMLHGNATYHPLNTSELKDSILYWRPKVSETGLEILTDNTVLVCPMQYEKGWPFKQADVMNGDSITLNKQGTDCYFMSGEEVTTGSQTIDALEIKKLTSDSVTLTNNSGMFTKVILIYK